MEHYIGPKKVNSPFVPLTSRITNEDLCAEEKSLRSAEQRDTQWLNSLTLEWSGFNNHLDKVGGLTPLKASTVYLIGHLIDATPLI